MDKAVILARGLGTRMRKTNDAAELTDDQANTAKSGVKAMIPIDRPFLDYVINELADAGYKKICLVIGNEHESIKQYYRSLDAKRVSFEFAIQAEPLGTANAVAAAEDFAADDPFVVINSDNFYPAVALKALQELNGPGLIGFDRDSMVEDSNIQAERILKFAIVQTDPDGFLNKIIEKPTAEDLANSTKPIGVSMNCWRLNKTIFEACRNIKPSVRDEYELPDAVEYTMHKLGQKYKLIPLKEAVLDLTSQDDIAPVTKKLKAMEVSL